MSSYFTIMFFVYSNLKIIVPEKHRFPEKKKIIIIIFLYTFSKKINDKNPCLVKAGIKVILISVIPNHLSKLK